MRAHDKEITIASTWWADLFREGRNLDHHVYQAEALALAEMARQTYPFLTSRQIDKFERALEKELRITIRDGYFSVRLEVDHEPEGVLARAAEASDFPTGKFVFPWKTYMIIRPGTVEVKLGLMGNWVKVYDGDKLPPRPSGWLLEV